MAYAPITPRLPPDWPLAAHSRFISCPPHLWHVQVLGNGPPLLLLHGAGAATHSWRALAPLLATGYTLIMPDLPGHGFTRLGRRDRSGLDAMAQDLVTLCAAEGWAPVAVIGHSAGAALALRLAELLPLRAVAGINAALRNFDGAAGVLFPVIARLLALNPVVPAVFARLAGSEGQVHRLLAGTGSPLDPAGRRMYQRLVQDPAHVDGALAMMAQWQLDGLLSRLPQIAVPTLLLTASGDRAVPPAVSRAAATGMPQATVTNIVGPGHLVHEEAAGQIMVALRPFLMQHLKTSE